MHLENRIQAFHQLGILLKTLPSEKLEHWCDLARSQNPWFTTPSVQLAVTGISSFLDEQTLREWTSKYVLENGGSKKIAIIMAGNIPLVGFHDFLCVLISGHQVVMKLSSKDSQLIKQIIDALVSIEPAFSEKIMIEENLLKSFDAVIATGSDNSARYFHQYFGKYPNIIRKNRTSCAVLTGKETNQELTLLGRDVFTHFGLGCRNVSKLYVPKNYNLKNLLENWKGFEDITHHHKYCNNYDYQKAILLVNLQDHLDTGYVLLHESDKLVSPIAVIYCEYYTSEDDVINKIIANRDKLQCIVGNEEFCTVAFGEAQLPKVWEYADDVDTLKFLTALP